MSRVGDAKFNIPSSYNKTKSMFKNLVLDYEKNDACPNDCMLFRNDHKDDEFCHTGGASLYIKNPEVDGEVESSKKSNRFSVNTLRHFPLIPRLIRLFMCSKTADSLRWHDKERSKDESEGILLMVKHGKILIGIQILL